MTRHRVQKSEHDRILAVLEESGLLEPLGEGWKEIISRGEVLPHDELRRRLQGGSSLSELIIAERNEGR